MEKFAARIVDIEKMTVGRRRYWVRLSLVLADQVDIIDPWRLPLRELRDRYPQGTRVYRCSTGGRWGKSAVKVTL